MVLSLAQASQKIGTMLDVDVQSGDFPNHVRDWLNEGGRRVYEARPWFGRETETLLTTVAVYSTGTATATQESTSVTGSSTTWTTGMTGRKFSLGVGNPWYRFTRTGNGALTLAQAYAESSVTNNTYTIFQDEFDLPSDCVTVGDVSLLHSRFHGRMRRSTMQAMDDAYYVNARQGPPETWAPTLLQTANTHRIRVSPVPNDIYRIRVLYLKAYTDLMAPGDLFGGGLSISSQMERAWILASCIEAQRSGDSRPVTSEAEVMAAIEEAWTKAQEQSPTVLRKVAVGSGMAWPLFWMNDDNPFPS